LYVADYISITRTLLSITSKKNHFLNRKSSKKMILTKDKENNGPYNSLKFYQEKVIPEDDI